jgi:CTP:phosphocholine cytidylyltransferase-like protein
MNVGILAEGLGSRLVEQTEVWPKPMLEIGGKPTTDVGSLEAGPASIWVGSSCEI